MVCWRGEKYWVGKLIDPPGGMTQGETLEELEENLVDAYKVLALDEVD
jgi:predicted RNase H-like HicB family nuclease